VPDGPPAVASETLSEAAIPPLGAQTGTDGAANPGTVLTDAGGVGPGSAAPVEAGTIVWKPNAGIVAPQVLFRVDPKYPEVARTARRQGAVVVEAEIATDGSLQSARVVSSPLGFGLEQSALEAIRLALRAGARRPAGGRYYRKFAQPAVAPSPVACGVRRSEDSVPDAASLFAPARKARE
jgi:TonB family protein